MKTKTILDAIGLSVILLLFLHYIYLIVEVENMKKTTIQLTSSVRFKNHIESANAQYNRKTDTIFLYIKLKDAYDKMNVIQQFGTLEYFHKQLRYYMRNSDSTSNTDHSQIQLITKITTNNYYFTNVVPEENVFTKSESTFYSNGEKVYISSMFK